MHYDSETRDRKLNKADNEDKQDVYADLQVSTVFFPLKKNKPWGNTGAEPAAVQHGAATT